MTCKPLLFYTSDFQMTTKATFELGHCDHVSGVSWWIQQPCLVGIILECAKVQWWKRACPKTKGITVTTVGTLQSISRDISKLFWGVAVGKRGEDPAERTWIFSTTCVATVVWWELWDAKLPIKSENSRFSHAGRLARDLTIILVQDARTCICSQVWAILRQIHVADICIYMYMVHVCIDINIPREDYLGYLFPSPGLHRCCRKINCQPFLHRHPSSESVTFDPITAHRGLFRKPVESAWINTPEKRPS